ncbi:MAG TPA: TIGR00341 family protein, partial [Nitrospira sp.]
MRNTIHACASLTPTYLVMNMLATIIACYGLLADSAAGIIGAMVIAMLLGPIAGAGLAMVDGDLALLRKSLLAEMAGVAVVMATAFVIGIFHKDIPPGTEMLARTNPGYPDLMIALAGGAAATAASVSRGISLSLVGVAIATALVPPLSTSSMLLARGSKELALGAFLLAVTNMVAIQFTSSVVFWIAGYS